jgi:hypothetical protein
MPSQRILAVKASTYIEKCFFAEICFAFPERKAFLPTR